MQCPFQQVKMTFDYIQYLLNSISMNDRSLSRKTRMFVYFYLDLLTLQYYLQASADLYKLRTYSSYYIHGASYRYGNDSIQGHHCIKVLDLGHTLGSWTTIILIWLIFFVYYKETTAYNWVWSYSKLEERMEWRLDLHLVIRLSQWRTIMWCLDRV